MPERRRSGPQASGWDGMVVVFARVFFHTGCVEKLQPSHVDMFLQREHPSLRVEIGVI